jgi:hypothetical protein
MTETEIIGLIALAVGYSTGVMLGWVLGVELGWVLWRKPYLEKTK